MKVIEKRAPRSYKAKQTPYVKARQRAKKNNLSLAELVELWVESYGRGDEIIISSKK